MPTTNSNTRADVLPFCATFPRNKSHNFGVAYTFAEDLFTNSILLLKFEANRRHQWRDETLAKATFDPNAARAAISLPAHNVRFASHGQVRISLINLISTYLTLDIGSNTEIHKNAVLVHEHQGLAICLW